MHQLAEVVALWESQNTGELTTASVLLLTHQGLHDPLFQGHLDQLFPFSGDF